MRQTLPLFSTPFRLELSQIGSLNHLLLQPTVVPSPEDDEIQIEVKAIGLNFRELLRVFGLYPGLTPVPIIFGGDCTGIVTSVGANVNQFQVGDAVMGVALNAFSSHLTVPAHLMITKPKNLTFIEAATIPTVFMTAYYALCHLAQLSQHERVLIHAGAGGIGLAAIQISQWLGAEIFTTASLKKQAYLRSLGVNHVFNSRSLEFADDVMASTDGQGVDVVLNALAGEFIPKSMSVLRKFGRFLELGKRDIYENSRLELYPFRNNLSFFAIDLEQVWAERPQLSQQLLGDIKQHFENGSLKSLPYTVFSMSDIISAFYYMRQAKHIGKIVVSLIA